MRTQPGQGLGVKPIHRDLGQELLELKPKVTNPSIRQNDIRIEDLAGHGIHATGPNSRANIIIQPTHKVVTNIFRVLVHVSTGLLVLVVNFDRTGNTNFFKSSIPAKDSFSHPTTVTHGRRVLNVKHDRVFRRTHLERRISLFQVPSVDVPHAGFIVRVLTVITVRGREITDPLICFSRLVRGLGRNFTDRIMQGLQLANTGWYFKSDLDIAGKCLGLLDRKQGSKLPVHHVRSKKLGSLGNQ